MPTFSLSNIGQPISSTALASGTYYATSLALTEEARGGDAIKVEVGKVELLTADNNSYLWTDSIAVCFPVVFKFKNGDIGLYHGNSVSIGQNLIPLLDSDDLVEIQLFENGTEKHSHKLNLFTNYLLTYFQNKENNVPAINIQDMGNSTPFCAAICYRSPDGGGPIILIGDSAYPALVTNIAECSNQGDEVRAYSFVPAASKYPPLTPSQGSQLQEVAIKAYLESKIRNDENKKNFENDRRLELEVREQDTQYSCCVIS